MKKGIQVLIRLICLCAISTTINLYSQTTIAFQGGEGTAADNWNFAAITNAGGPIPPGIVATLPRTGTRSIRACGGNTAGCGGGSNCISAGGATGCPMHGTTIQFDPINTTCLSNVVLTCYHRSHTSCSGSGLDAGETVNFEVRLNGGAWTTISTLTGGSDFTWSYTTNPANGVPNPFVYNVPGGTTSFEFRVRGVTNRSDEVFYIDDVSLTTTTTIYSFPGTAGLWKGFQNTNWFNACNWDNRVVPTLATNVSFSTSNTVSNNDIVLTTGTSAECNNLSIVGGSSNNYSIKGENGPTKVLRVYGNLTLNGQDGLDFSDGTTGTPDGTIELKGNWDNQIGEAEFKQGESTIIFNGTGTQNVTITGAGPEIFYSTQINKVSGSVNLNDNIEVCGNSGDPLADRAGILTLTSGNIITNANYIYVVNPAIGGVSGGSTTSFVDGNFRRQSNVVGLYDYPCGDGTRFMRAALRTTSTSVTVMEVDAQNTGYGIYTPLEATIFDISHFRWWDISKISGSSNVNVRLYWLGTPAAEGIINENDLVIAHYSDRNHVNAVSTLQWWNRGRSVANSSGLVNNGYVEGSETEQTFSPHTIGTITSTNPLPVELINFEANCTNGTINLYWTTTTEINNDHFEVEGSADGVTYESLINVGGAGNSNSIKNYEVNLNNPHRNNYFRLVQYDFNGTSKHYPPAYLSCQPQNENLIAYYNGTSLQIIFPENISNDLSYTILDVNGKMILTGLTTKTQVISLNNEVAAGIYILNVVDNVTRSNYFAKFFKN